MHDCVLLLFGTHIAHASVTRRDHHGVYINNLSGEIESREHQDNAISLRISVNLSFELIY